MPAVNAVQAITDLLDPNLFEAWLRTFPPDVIVGIPDCADGCPLYEYLFAKGYRVWRVEATGVWLRRGRRRVVPQHPVLTRFVVLLDNWFAGAAPDVTADEALAVLAQAVKDDAAGGE